MHELVAALDSVGLRLSQALVDMLDNRPEHCTPRRGCGLTQATRLLAARVNVVAGAHGMEDLELLGEWSARLLAALDQCMGAAGSGWRTWLSSPVPADLPKTLQATAGRIADLPAQIDRAAAALTQQESRLLLGLIKGILLRDASARMPLPVMLDKPQVGSCSQAEEFFLELAHARVRRGGWVNLYLDDCGTPLLLEKMQLGESHSAILLAPVSLGGVELPPGSSCATARHPGVEASLRLPKGWAYPIESLQAVRFLRLTTLAVEPAHRQRAFSAQVDAQCQGDMLSPLTTRIEDLAAFATEQIRLGSPA